MKPIFRITIELDSDAQDPTTNDSSWKVYTFSEDHNHLITDVERDRFYTEDEDGNETFEDELADKLARGYAFRLRYSEHGISNYETCDDSEDGFVVWENDENELNRDPVIREKDAFSFLSEYTDWANGQCFGYRIERIKSTSPDFDPDDPSFNGAFWEDVDSCWGFIGHDVINEEVKGIVKDILEEHPDATIIYEGEAAHVLDV